MPQNGGFAKRAREGEKPFSTALAATAQKSRQATHPGKPPFPVLIGLGGNRVGGEADGVGATLERAAALFPAFGIDMRMRSSWHHSAAVSAVPQEGYVNGVALVATLLPPLRLLAALQRIEKIFARRRHGEPRWGARSLDLDLLAYGDIIRPPRVNGGRLILPHPEMHRRAFVLAPLLELLPDWRHPLLGESAAVLLARLQGGKF